MSDSMRQEVIIGAGEVFMYEFDGTEIPDHSVIETDEHNVGHCSSGFSIDYKPEKYEAKNQYGTTVKIKIINQAITTRTGIMSWDLDRMALLSTAKIKVSSDNVKLTIGTRGTLKNVLVRFVHEKDDGKKIRFTMIGQAGNGFALEFANAAVSVDAQIDAIEYIKGFLCEIEEEIGTGESQTI